MGQQLAVTDFVLFLDGSDIAEHGGDHREPFLFGHFGERRVKFAPLLVLSGCSLD